MSSRTGYRSSDAGCGLDGIHFRNKPCPDIIVGKCSPAVLGWSFFAAVLFCQVAFSQSLQIRTNAEPVTPVAAFPAVTAQPAIPVNASQTLRDFLTTQAVLMSAQVGSAAPAGLSLNAARTGVNQSLQNNTETFAQQYSAELQLQRQRQQALAAEEAQIPMPVSTAMNIPQNATPRLKAYLVAKAAFVQANIEMRNQYLGADSSARQAAILQWWQQNSAQLDQLRQMASQLSGPGAGK